MLPPQTPWDHTSVGVSLYILEMDKAAQVVVRFPLKKEKSHLSWWEKSYFSAGAVDDLFYTVFNHVTKPVRSFFETQNSDAFCLFLLPLDGRYINDRQHSGTKSQVWL